MTINSEKGQIIFRPFKTILIYNCIVIRIKMLRIIRRNPAGLFNCNYVKKNNFYCFKEIIIIFASIYK